MERSLLIRSYKNVTMGVFGILNLNPDDTLMSEIYYKTNGVIDYEVQYLNGRFIGTRKYFYFVTN